MAAMIITNSTLLISSKPISYVSIFQRKLTSKQCLISSNAPAINAFKLCSSHSQRTAATSGDQSHKSTKQTRLEAEVLVTRRSANYNPSFWDFDYIQSLNSEYKEERYLRRCSELKGQVKMLMEEGMMLMETVEQLEFIDDLQRLGISYHFKDQINNILNHIHENKYGKNYHHELKETSLYSTALEFRLLRQHGFVVSPDVFSCFKNEKGDEFKGSLGEDTKGLLQVYEASFLSTEGESILDQAWEFATIFLRRNLDQGLISDENRYLSLFVTQSLELPLHWSVVRAKVRAFIEAYDSRSDMNPILLELAKLDFNIVQAIHQEELKNVSRWWKSRWLTKSLPFVRDRAVENYIWSLAMIEHPKYGNQRIMFAELIGLVTSVDDIFDVYGTLEELQIFTDAFQRWDIELIEQLPEYMQTCYLAVYNFINELAYDVLKEKGCIVIKYLRKLWTDITRSFMQEAIWYHNGITPTLDDYLNNAFISSGNPIVLMHIFFVLRNPIQKEEVDELLLYKKYHNIVRLSSIIVRLADDLGTGPVEMERGDVSKTMQCYMNDQTDHASEKEAQEYIMHLIRETWKKLNKEILLQDSSSLSPDFIATSVNAARLAHLFYLQLNKNISILYNNKLLKFKN